MADARCSQTAGNGRVADTQTTCDAGDRTVAQQHALPGRWCIPHWMRLWAPVFISWSQCACAQTLRLVAFGERACGKQHGSQLNDHAWRHERARARTQCARLCGDCSADEADKDPRADRRIRLDAPRTRSNRRMSPAARAHHGADAAGAAAVRFQSGVGACCIQRRKKSSRRRLP